MNLFSEVNAALAQSADVIARRSAASSAVARALISADEMRAREELERSVEKIDAGLRQLESTAVMWDRRPESLAALARESAFLEKWHGLTREALAKLSVAPP
jgi:hypothetical protein